MNQFEKMAVIAYMGNEVLDQPANPDVQTSLVLSVRMSTRRFCHQVHVVIGSQNSSAADQVQCSRWKENGL